MIPILFGKNATDFSTNGIGRLSDAISCTVTLEANGGYELAMTYPMTGEHFADIQMDSIILAKPDGRRNNQAFRVYKISKPLNGQVTINAEHISYQLSRIPVSPFSATSAADALTGLKNHAAVDCPFTFWTDKASSGDFAIAVPVSIRSTLGGTEGSILDVYGGEYDFDMYTVRLYEKQGQDNGVSIRYGKNLMDLTQEESISNTITGIMPYWKDSDGNVMTLDSKVVMSDAAENYPYPRITVMDFSSEFESQPTQPQLQQAAEDYIERNNIGVPSVSLSVSFAQLWQTEEYKDIAPLEEVAIFDTVTVQFEELGVDAKAAIRETVYDVLLERYDSVEIGDARSNLSTTIAEQQEKIDKAPTTTAMQHAIQNATELITGNKGGYLIFRYDADGQPYEMLIMDTPDINTAKKVWRWNQGGLGYSQNGYNGPYTTAITQDGAIVADFITAGTMLANIIHGGTLTLGGQENGNGVCRVLDTAGNEVARLDVDGLNVRRGIISGVTINLGNNFIATSSGQITAKNGNIGIWEFYDQVFMTTDYKLQFVKQSDGSWHISNLDGGISCKGASFGGLVTCANGLQVSGGLSVSGTKNRLAETESYGKRLLNAYETAVPYFGDIGTGEISPNGIGIVEIDPIFSETVSLDNYVVFLQAEGPGECYIGEKSRDRFKVFGTPGLRFAYEIKAKQKGFENVRLDKYKEEKA